MSVQAIKPEYLTPGTTVGAYQVVEQVAAGGFGYVYRVSRDGKIYALKIGRARLSALAPDERASSVERLEREIAALTSLHHRNIVRVHSFERWPDLEGGFPYLVMDFVAGLPLQEWRTGATPALDRIVAVFEKIAGALDHMHQLGIIHRDLKSPNILVNTEGEPFIVDFGIARPRVARDLTQAAGIGTLTHLTPEYVAFLDSEEAGKGIQFDWRPATDLYAVGYVLYEALTGVPPVPRFSEGTAKEESLLLSAIKTSAPRRPREILPLIPQALDDLVMQLLEKDPLKRPQGAAEVAARLREAREAGEAASDAVWTRPFDLPGVVGAGRAGEGGRPTRSESEDGEHIEKIGEGEVAREGTAKPTATVAAPAQASTSFSAPTTEGQSAFDDGGEAAEAKPEPAEDRWSRESKLIKRAAGAWAAAAPRPRRWPIAVAIAAGSAVLLVVLFLASSGTTDRTGPKSLLSSVEAGASPAASSFNAAPVDTSPSPPAQRPAPIAADRAPPEPSLRAIPLGESRPDAQDLAGQNGRLTILPDGRVVTQPPPQRQDQAGLVRSRPLGPEPQVLQWSQRVASTSPPVPDAKKARGVPYGAHVQARLVTNLDTRTIGNGPVEALLAAPYVVRGQVMLPTRTMVYGTASESGGRFTIRFTRLRLPDDTEVAFEGIALARDDGKPGLAASGRVGEEPKRGEGLGKNIAKGTGNILLDTITGGTGSSIVRNAGQAALGHEEAQPVSSQWALLLDAGVMFDIFVERAF